MLNLTYASFSSIDGQCQGLADRLDGGATQSHGSDQQCRSEDLKTVLNAA